MGWYQNFFLVGQIPSNVMTGVYNIKLVILSYVIATITSYVALDMNSHLKRENTSVFKFWWWLGSSFVMGAGIWSMHFIGMLAYDMNMPMSYNINWTIVSMIVAVFSAAIAFLFLMMKRPRPIHYILSGIILGASIPTMHYTGMASMTNVDILYKPNLFVLSILVAVFAATAALWLSNHSDKGNYVRRIQLKIISAMIMGVAIAGMHYVGMYAAVIIPSNRVEIGLSADPFMLSVVISSIVLSIMLVALILSNTKYYVSNSISNDKEFLEIVLNSLRGSVIAFYNDQRLRLYNDATKKMFPNLEEVKDDVLAWDEKLPLLDVNNKKPYLADDYPLQQVFKGKKIKGMEALIINNVGKEKTISIDGQLLVDQFGDTIGAVMIYQDITERKEIDQMKNEFISTVSHELRTPLTSIRGSLGLITSGSMGNVPKEISSLLEIACNNSERLVRLINDILDTEKIESGKMVFHFAKEDLSKLVEQAVQSNKPYADKYDVTYEIKDIIPQSYVLMDSDRIRQVLDNLLSNAAKFSKKNGVVTIVMHKENNVFKVSVSDTGVGIPQEFQSRIFSKFYQADSSDVREKGGTGLGLSICKSIIEAHNGKIWFESSSQGTTFFFELLESPLDNTLESDDDPACLNNCILICEDDPDVSKLLGLILKERGFSSVRVATIADAKEALEHQNYCLMTLDLMLPDGNGLDLLKWMRTKSNLEKLPVVVISAISIEQEKIKGTALGVVDWINKPIDEERLYKDVSLALGTTENKNKHRVLHIEDDADISKIVSTLIKNICEVDVSTSVEEAKKLLTNMKYSLIILDLNLKQGTGYEILTFLDEFGYKVPVIILSVDELQQDVSKNIVASLVKSKVSNKDLLEQIITAIENSKRN